MPTNFEFCLYAFLYYCGGHHDYGWSNEFQDEFGGDYDYDYDGPFFHEILTGLAEEFFNV